MSADGRAAGLRLTFGEVTRDGYADYARPVVLLFCARRHAELDLNGPGVSTRVFSIMSIRVRLFVAAVAACALGSVWLLYGLWPKPEAAYLPVIACFVGLGAFSHLLAYSLARGASGSIAFIPLLAAAALAPHWMTVLAMAATDILVEIIHRRPAIKAVFNTAQHALAVSTAIILYRLLGGDSLLAGSAAPLAFIALFIVFMFMNTIAVSCVVAFNENRNPVVVWAENTLGTVAYDVLAMPIVFGFALVYVHFGALGAVLLTLPLLGVRQQYKTNWQLEQVNQELLQLMVAAIEARDPYTSGHSQRVARYAQIVARAAGLNRRQIERVRTAALLHDVGKIHEDYAPILRKPDKLTSEETAIMQTHAARGAELVANVSHLKDLVASIRHHHENWDGSGYPDGIAGTEIPLIARIVKIADTIDAMTTDRPYRAALAEADVKRELVLYKGRQFDPVLCDALLGSGFFRLIFDGSSATPSLQRIPAYSKRRTPALGGRVAAGPI